MNNLMLYIHIPFCEKKCNYCDFVSFYANYETCDKYIKVLLKEIESKKYLANDYIISSIYIGGGTPSFLDQKYISFIIESLKNNYKLSDSCEISIEINPHSTIFEKLATYHNIGINRLSIGLQSCIDSELSALGRIHTYNDFLKVYDDAIHAGFKNINIDLINGIPEQTAESYKKSLKQILMLHTNHLSVYNLIIEKNTVFHKLYYDNKLKLPTENEMEKIDNVTKELTEYYRLNKYEISNYAKPGYECKHNLGYWSDIPYLGFGLNASSYYENKRYKNRKNLNEYLNLNYDSYFLDDKKINYYDEILIPNENELMGEYIMLGMRKSSGINSKSFFKKFNTDLYEKYKNPFDKYISNGLIIKNEDNYYFSDKGFNVSNTILSEFI